MTEKPHLHPMTLAEILDRTAQIYRSRFLVFFGIGVIPAGVIFVLAAGIFAFFSWYGSNSHPNAHAADIIVWTFLIVLLLLVVPVGLAVTALGAAAMTDAAGRSFLGEKITIREAYKSARNRGWRYVWLYLLVGLVVVGVPVAAAILVGLGANLLNALSSRIGLGDIHLLVDSTGYLLLIVMVAFGLWMLLRFCLSFPVSVVEQSGAWKSFKRAGSISHGTKARIILLYLLGTVLGYILTIGVSIPLIILLALMPGLQGRQHSDTLGTVLLFVTYGSYFAVKAFTKPVYGIALTLFYFDQRIRTEGFDIEWMMQHAGMAIEAPPALEPSLPESPTPAIPSGTPQLESAAESFANLSHEPEFSTSPVFAEPILEQNTAAHLEPTMINELEQRPQ